MIMAALKMCSLYKENHLARLDELDLGKRIIVLDHENTKWK